MSRPGPMEDHVTHSSESLRRLCLHGLTEIGADGMAAVITSQRTPQRVIVHCGDLGLDLPDAEFALGEGPGFDVARTGAVIEVPDLRDPHHHRWPVFTRIALDNGVMGIHAFPLQRGLVVLGVLEFFCAQATALDANRFSAGLATADQITEVLLGLPRDVETDVDSTSWMAPDADRLRIHQATGMVAQALGCSVEDALDRMRAYSFAHQVSLLETANLILARELQLEGDS